jgi:PAS domain S-box-containing protein
MIVQSVGGDDRIRTGDTCPLDRAYCRKTVESETVLAVQNAAVSPDVTPAAYAHFGLGSYLGARVVVDGESYGSVCFADREARTESFDEADQLFVELVARLVGQALERRAYEERLEARNERIERIADTTFDLLFEIGPDSALRYVSSGIEEVLGYDPEEADGTPFAEYVAPSSLSDALEAFEQVFDGEPVRNLELMAETAHGDRAVIEINATPVFEDGEVVAAQGVARDVTTRYHNEAELRVMTRAIDSANVGIVIADASRPDNPVSYVNEAFEELTGYPSGAVLGRNCRLLQGPKTDEEASAAIRDAVDAAEPVSVDLLNYRRNGAPFWNNVRVVPVEDETGDVTHFVGFQEDVTDRIRTNSHIELLNRILRHNLRNELNVIRGYSELASDPDHTAAPDTDPETVIYDTIDELLSLSDQVRELEQIARQDRDPTRLAVPDLLEAIRGHARTCAPEATIDCRVDLPAGRGVCAGDELARALRELVENALCHDTDPPTTVSVTVRPAGDDVEIVLADDGPGIPPVEASVVEAGRETAVEHGTGLGLWLVNWIVTRYGGSFQIRPATDDEAVGTVAVVTLPGLDPDDEPQDVVRPHTTLFQ